MIDNLKLMKNMSLLKLHFFLLPVHALRISALSALCAQVFKINRYPTVHLPVQYSALVYWCTRF